MTSQLVEQKDKARLAHVQKQVQSALTAMPGLVSGSEATRLTLGLWSAAMDSIADMASRGKQFTWTEDGIRYFITQAIKFVALGLDAVNREVYVYPYGERMTITPSAHGLVKLAKEHAVGDRKILDMLKFAVREGEEFRVTYGAKTDDWEYHNILFNTAKPIGYVTILVYDDGTSRVMEHTLQDIEKRRAVSKAKNSPAWTNWPVEMALAKSIRRHANTVNIKLRPEVKQLGIERLDDLPDDDNMDDIKDVTPDIISLPDPIQKPATIEVKPRPPFQPVQPKEPEPEEPQEEWPPSPLPEDDVPLPFEPDGQMDWMR